jgi:hypothetical protein
VFYFTKKGSRTETENLKPLEIYQEELKKLSSKTELKNKELSSKIISFERMKTCLNKRRRKLQYKPKYLNAQTVKQNSNKKGKHLDLIHNG